MAGAQTAICSAEHPAGGIRLADHVARRLAADHRRIVVVGAGGWIGRSLVEMLRGALGKFDFTARVSCFGSQARDLALADGTTLRQRPLAELATMPAAPTMLLHLAFVTKDRVGDMSEANYVAANRAISATVADALGPLGVDRLFVASSGAAAFADDPGAAHDLRLYGSLKRDDERRFAAWAEAKPGRRALVARIYAVSGPFINKPETYALADLILAVLAGGQATVRAPMPVWRSYVAVRELLSLAFAELLADEGPAARLIATGGEPLELGDLAIRVATVLGGSAASPRTTAGQENRYLGDHRQWLELLAAHNLAHLPIDEQIAETAAWLIPAGRE